MVFWKKSGVLGWGYIWFSQFFKSLLRRPCFWKVFGWLRFTCFPFYTSIVFFVCKILTPSLSRSYASELNKARSWQNISDPTCVECSKNVFTVNFDTPQLQTCVCHVPHFSPKQSLHETLGNPVVFDAFDPKKNAKAKIAMEITSLFPHGLHLHEFAAGRVDWNTPERAPKSHIGQIWVYELAGMYISYTRLIETIGRQNWYSSG